MADDKQKSAIEDIGCLEAIQHLHEYLDGELAQETSTRVKEHLDHCRSCFSRSEFETALSKRIKDSGGDKAPDQLKHRVHKLMEDF